MKKVLLLIIFCSAAAFALYKGYQKENMISKQNVSVNAVQNKNTNSAGKYKYKKLDSSTLSYIKKFRGGQLVKDTDSSKKLFLYYDFKVPNCPYRKYFQGLMSQYKEDERWTSKYEIKGLEYPTNSIPVEYIVGSPEEKEFSAYNRDCGESFCIVDIANNKIFIPEKGSIYTSQQDVYKYIYGVLSDFYNK